MTSTAVCRFRRSARWLALVATIGLGATAAGAAPEPPVRVRLAEHPSWAGLKPANDSIGVRLSAALATSSAYAMNTWWLRYMNGVEPYWSSSGRLTKAGTMDSGEVRRYSCVAFGLAAAIVSGAYDARIAGVDVGTATTRTVEIVDFAARTHRANLGTSAGWGGSWQSAMWAGEIGAAGWLVRGSLPSATEALVARMLEFEADAVTARRHHYYRDRRGVIISPGDTGAEELAWDAFGVMTAVELLPSHPRRQAWAEAAYSRFAGAYSRPSDVGSRAPVHGRPLTSWLQGSNIEPSGIVVNHGVPNPDYTQDVALWSAPISALAGNGVPESVTLNADVLYRALTTLRFPAPPFRAPGGAVYQADRLYYPAGGGWGRNREVVYSSVDVQMAALSADPAIRASAAGWAVRHLDTTRRMQARFTTGQIYGPETEDRFSGREEYAIKLLGTAQLTWWLAANRWFRVDRSGVEAKAPR